MPTSPTARQAATAAQSTTLPAANLVARLKSAHDEYAAAREGNPRLGETAKEQMQSRERSWIALSTTVEAMLIARAPEPAAADLPEPRLSGAAAEPSDSRFIDGWNACHQAFSVALESLLSRIGDALSPDAGEPLLLGEVGVLTRIGRWRQALAFYAEGDHFVRADDTAWDTVSGEPANFFCDEASTATVEDGSVAAMALAGTPRQEQGADGVGADPPTGPAALWQYRQRTNFDRPWRKTTEQKAAVFRELGYEVRALDERSPASAVRAAYASAQGAGRRDERLLDTWTAASGIRGWCFDGQGALLGHKPTREDLLRLMALARGYLTLPSKEPQ